MPEFILNTPPRMAKSHPFYDLDTFARGYVEAMFFTNGDTGDEREFLLNEWGVERLTREAVASIKADCDAFLAKSFCDELGGGPHTVAEWLGSIGGDAEEQAGRDFWFTRQGHGVGFWSRDAETYQNEYIRDGFDRLARAVGEANVEAYRGWVYHR